MRPVTCGVDWSPVVAPELDALVDGGRVRAVAVDLADHLDVAAEREDRLILGGGPADDVAQLRDRARR